MPRVEDATLADANAIADMMRASIRELCEADHHGRRELIDRWCGNKTREHALGWIADPRTSVLLVRSGQEVAAAGACADGRVLLNYVAPAYRFQGFSRAILRRMEEILRQEGTACARLTSTVTAHRFYANAGWYDEGQAETSGDLVGYPMAKTLDV